MTMNQVKTLVKNGDIDVLATLLVALAFGWSTVEANEPEVKLNDQLALDTFDMLTRNKLVGKSRASALLNHFGPARLIRILVEREEEELLTCDGIGKKLAERMMRALPYLAEQLAEVHSIELSMNGEVPCHVVFSKDTEQEYPVTVYEMECDEQGFPVPCKSTIWDCSADINAYSTTSGTDPVLLPQAAIADLERSAAGFMPEEIADLGGEPKTFDLPGMSKSRHRNFVKAMLYLNKPRDERVLRDLWKRFWQKYWILKEKNELLTWLTNKQRTSIVARFKELGIEPRKR